MQLLACGTKVLESFEVTLSFRVDAVARDSLNQTDGICLQRLMVTQPAKLHRGSAPIAEQFLVKVCGYLSSGID